MTGDRADDHYVSVDGEVMEPEFCRMSLKPGIGSTWLEKYTSDVFPRDYCVVRGNRSGLPRYYSNKLKEVYPVQWTDVEYDRWKRSLECILDSTAARLAVREEVARARLVFKRRTLE